FLEGYFVGDGSKDGTGSKLTFGTSSPDLANGLLYLLGQLGILAGLSRRPSAKSEVRGRQVATGTSYTVNVTGKEALTRLRRLWHAAPCAGAYEAYIARDRKSTRLNSSHRTISYAVFCLKNKH